MIEKNLNASLQMKDKLQWKSICSWDICKLSIDFILNMHIRTKARFCEHKTSQIYKTIRMPEPAQKSQSAEDCEYVHLLPKITIHLAIGH